MIDRDSRLTTIYDCNPKQFGELAKRVNQAEYFEVVNEIQLPVENKFADAMSIIPLDDKESFGDIDMVIIWDKSQDESGEDYYKEIFGDKMIGYRHLKNDKMDSVLLRLESNKVVQVDFARTKNEVEFQAKMIHSSKGHSSSVIGTLAMAYGYKFAQDGFYKRYFDKIGQYHDILVTEDLMLGMEMLGLDPNRWIEATKVDDIVDFISCSAFFESKFFDRKTMKNKRRAAISKRGVQDYLYSQLEARMSSANHRDHKTFFEEGFPEYQMQVEEKIRAIDSAMFVFGINGEVVMEVFKIPPSKLVGEILLFIRQVSPGAEAISQDLKEIILKNFNL